MEKGPGGEFGGGDSGEFAMGFWFLTAVQGYPLLGIPIMIGRLLYAVPLPGTSTGDFVT